MKKILLFLLIVFTGVGFPLVSALALTGGDGIAVDDGDIDVDLLTSGADDDSSTTDSASGLEFVGGKLSLLRGCSDTQVLAWDEDNDEWACAAASSGSSISFDKENDTTNDSDAITHLECDGGSGMACAEPSDNQAQIGVAAILDAIAALSSTGIIARTGSGTVAVRTVTAGDGIAVTNGDGVSGNPTAAVDILDSGSDADSSSTSSDSGLEFVGSDLTLLRGCDSGQVLKWDETNDEWDCAADTDTNTSTPATWAFHSETPVTVGTSGGGEVYMSLSGMVSTTEADVRTPFDNAVTLENIQCVASGNTTQAITAVVGENGCTSAADFSSKAQVVMSATANTAGTSTGSTSVSAGECAVVRMTVASSTSASATIKCTIERTDKS